MAEKEYKKPLYICVPEVDPEERRMLKAIAKNSRMSLGELCYKYFVHQMIYGELPKVKEWRRFNG